MEIPMSGMTNKSIEEQYTEGPEVNDLNIPSAQQQPMTVEEANDFLDNQLPLMRKQGEYDRLIIEQLTNDVLLNRRPSNQVPGLLGLELKVREIQAQQFLTQYTASLSDRITAQKEKEDAIRIASIETGVDETLEYDGDNAAAIIDISKGQLIGTTPEMKIDENNIEKRITFSVPDKNYQLGYRELSLIPGDSIVRYKDGASWIISKK